MCDEGVRLYRTLRELFPDAMWSGDWTRFDEVRKELEAHLQVEEPAAPDRSASA